MQRMKSARIFIAADATQPWSSGLHLPLAPEHHHYLRRVLRLKDDETFLVSDGRGQRWSAQFDTHASAPQLILRECCPTHAEPDLTTWLIQGLSTGDKMDWTIEKAVELGVSEVIPLSAERSVSRLTPSSQERKQRHWQSVAQAAALQCGRDVLPQVASVATQAEVLHRCSALAQRWVLSPGPGLRLRDLAARLPAGVTVAIAVGPESGWSADELHRFVTAGWQPLSLGPRVLRTETAGLAALAGLEALLGAS